MIEEDTAPKPEEREDWEGKRKEEQCNRTLLKTVEQSISEFTGLALLSELLPVPPGLGETKAQRRVTLTVFRNPGQQDCLL